MTPSWVVMLSTGVAALVAIWGIYTQRVIAARRATLDLILKFETDADVIAARKRFIELVKSTDGLVAWVGADKEASEEVQMIRLVLNEYELIAIAIQRGILDFELYKRWFRSGVIRHWLHAKPFVDALRSRTTNPALFREFEAMAGWMERGEGPPRAWLGRLF